ncbi:MAG: phosphonate ABC transporter, permease protein PhnE [Granulosicoccus sp.]|nr:phosphonate ABC transporter, permease protein PhnE [Granulosicoccus sp.]
MTTANTSTFDDVQIAVEKNARKQRFWFFSVLSVIFIYLAFSWVQFDIGSIRDKWRPDRAAMFVLDTYAHKDHVTMRWQSPEDIVVAFEGGHRHVYDPKPEWFSEEADGGNTVTYVNGGKATFYENEITLDWPNQSEIFRFRLGSDGKPYVVDYEGRSDELPEWIRQTENKVEIRPSLFERLQIGTRRVEAHRYKAGWAYFWFDFDSPLRDVSIFKALGLMLSSDRVVPEMSNAALVWTEFRDNTIWGHGTVLYAMLETIFMALLGTMIAAGVGLPLAFMAARNVQPVWVARFLLRRTFDTLRGIDTLIWSLIFLRAFGPGLFTGIFAIAFTDTGTLGKLMSEAIENADNKQREGIQSTGAKTIQQHRFGILPQIMPVFISQSLYYLESNTRSAVIIGAMGAGGIGLQFLGALQTGSDFENVAYMALLVLFTVIAMDALSSRLRRALIGYEKPIR